MIHWRRDLRRAITVGLLVWLFLAYFDDLISLAKAFVAASPGDRALIVSFTVIGLVAGYALWALITLVFKEAVNAFKKSEEPIDLDLLHWALVQPHSGSETPNDIVSRLSPIWEEAHSGKYIVSIEQARRQVVAHAVVTWILGGSVLSIETHHHTKMVIPLPHPGLAAASWHHIQVDLAGLAQDAIDDRQAYNAYDEIDSALKRAVVLVAMDWRPDGYTGPLTPSDLITHAISADKAFLAEHQDIITAIEEKLKDNDDTLNGVEVHSILDNFRPQQLSTLTPKPDTETAVSQQEHQTKNDVVS
jgi:hypothetical protein